MIHLSDPKARGGTQQQQEEQRNGGNLMSSYNHPKIFLRVLKLLLVVFIVKVGFWERFKVQSIYRHRARPSDGSMFQKTEQAGEFLTSREATGTDNNWTVTKHHSRSQKTHGNGSAIDAEVAVQQSGSKSSAKAIRKGNHTVVPPQMEKEEFKKTNLDDESKKTQGNNIATTSSLGKELETLNIDMEWNITDMIGNVDVNMTEEYVKGMILDYLRYDKTSFVLRSSICEETSMLCDVAPSNKIPRNLNQNSSDIQIWVSRLFYMMIHHNQHRYARVEATKRFILNAHGTDENTSSVGLFDYHCPSAKFLVVGLGPFGLGAHIRHVFVAAFLGGVISDRVVLFLNNQRSNNDLIGRPWGWASCPRRDFQCVFLPPSPCTVTKSELANATPIETSLLHSPPQDWAEYDNERVVFVDNLNGVWHPVIPYNWTHVLAEKAHKLIDHMEQSSNDKFPFLRAAADFIPNDPRGIGIPQVGQSKTADHPFGQMASLYSLRPNRQYHPYLESEIDRIFPPSYNPLHSFGLPVRGSEKCGESSCMPFGMYMELAMQQYRKGVWGTNPSEPVHLVLTSEEDTIMEQGKSYHENTTFPFTFVVNDKDPMQGSGFASDLKEHHSADFVIVSSLLAIKMQLQAKHLIGNCCSNFHMLMVDFIRSSAGVVPNATFECLRDNEEQRFRMCCFGCKPGDAYYNETASR
ncbi:hypothetical protein IV203_002221 [Nitzschia inconspicua]|uniref:Uncharacterized protein n=1 Tax=Nitzschia inconspicua TaxID=303405 RepID=A0A9K3L8V1_9STRA|nr:hypothetical protein IV203_002221 [Nitzschia inconspicua]